MEAFESSLDRNKRAQSGVSSIGSVARLQSSFDRAIRRDAERRLEGSSVSSNLRDDRVSAYKQPRPPPRPRHTPPPTARVAPQYAFSPPTYNEKTSWREHYGDEKASLPSYTGAVAKKKWWKTPVALWIGVGCLVLLLGGIAITLVTRAHSSKAASSNAASEGANEAGSTSATSTDANDAGTTAGEDPTPPIITTPIVHPTRSASSMSASATTSTSSAAAPSISLDPALHRAFYGIGYEPTDLLPNCETTQASVDEDLKILSQLTTRLRMYSSLCRQEEMVLDGITRLGLNLQVALGITSGSNVTKYNNDRTVALDLLQKYGVKYISHIIVGNEAILRDRSFTPTIVENLLDIRKRVAALGIDVPIGNSDASIGYYFNNKPNDALIDDGKVDFLMPNIHPWWGYIAPAAAADNAFTQFKQVQTRFGFDASKITFILGETGWPATMPGGRRYFEVDGAKAEASVANLQTYLDTFICQANQQGIPYYFFEYTDEPWKGDPNDPREGVEPWWGLFSADKKLKPGLKLPTCVLT